MNKWRVISYFYLLTSLFSFADGLHAKLHLQGGKMYVGSVLERSGQTVSFQPSQSTAVVPVPADSIELLEFEFDEPGMDQTDALFDNGLYDRLAPILSRQMPTYFPYAGIPSNLGSKWDQWLAALYWTGDYTRTLEAASAASKVRGQSVAVFNRALFYSMLSFLEQGNESERIRQFLDTEIGKALFLEGSAPRLYIHARLLQEEEKYIEAIRLSARIVADHGQDADWAPQAELLCAELYFQTGRPESARAVLESINECYSNPLITKKAAKIAARNRMENNL